MKILLMKPGTHSAGWCWGCQARQEMRSFTCCERCCWQWHWRQGGHPQRMAPRIWTCWLTSGWGVNDRGGWNRKPDRETKTHSCAKKHSWGEWLQKRGLQDLEGHCIMLLYSMLACSAPRACDSSFNHHNTTCVMLFHFQHILQTPINSHCLRLPSLRARPWIPYLQSNHLPHSFINFCRAAWGEGSWAV